MKPFDADHPLRTADSDARAATPGPDRTTDFAVGATPALEETAPLKSRQGAVPASASISVPGYEIVGVLGRGGMGVVYKARHLALKRTVALKMILAGGHAGPGELARFRIEAEAVARLSHPNIVQIHEVGEADGHPYCALEFVEGGNLASKIHRKPLSVREAAKLVESLARAMQLAHSRNVVHRDLKPANILLTADGTPKITDFGLARQMDSDSGETQTGAMMGTPSYMAPEQAEGRRHEAGPAADIYALGAILYDCLASRPPFKGKTTVEILDQVRAQEPAPPSRHKPGVPVDLETICLKCLRKEPENRYASAAELADELVRYLNGEPIQARPVGSLERGWRWCRRHPARAALIAAVTLLLLSATTFSLLLAERERKTAADLENYNRDLLREQNDKDAALKAARVGAARLALNRGLILCDQGDVSRGVLALTRAVAAAVEAGDADLESAARFNLAAWERQIWRLRAVLPGPEGTWVSGAAMNPQGTVLAVALANKTTQLWDAGEKSAGRVLHTLPHEGLVVELHFSPDGRLLLTRTDRDVHLWNVETGKLVCPPLHHEFRVLAMALAPDGKLILSGEENQAAGLKHAASTARLWDAETGRQQGKPLDHTDSVTAVAFRADGSRALAATRDGKVQVWKIPTGQADGDALSLGSWVTTARFSPDGQRMLAGTRAGKVHILDADGKPAFPPLVHDGPIDEIAFGPDGATLAVRTQLDAVSANARLWHAGTGHPITPPLDHPGDVRCFDFSPDGRMLLTAGRGGNARFWDTIRGVAVAPPLYHQGEVRAAIFSQDGRTLMTSDGVIRLWQAPRGYQRGPPLPHAQGAYAVAFSRDGKLVLTAGGDGAARLWHTANGESAAEPMRHSGPVLAVAFSPGGQLVLTGGAEKNARLWETATGKLRHVLEGHKTGCYAVAFAPDGSTALTGSFDGTARLWDVATGKPLGDPLPHGKAVKTVAFSPDGQLVFTGSDDKTARLWRVATRQPATEPLLHQHALETVIFSRDGRTAYTGELGGERAGKEVRCWDTATGQARVSFFGHQGAVHALAVAPAGDLLLSGSFDRTARFWNTETGQPVGPTLQHGDTVRDVAFGPDGRTALTGSFDKTARRWHVPTGIPIGPPLLHRGKIRAVALCADGRTAATASWDGTAVLWEAPPAQPGTLEQLTLWAEVITGMELDDGGAGRVLGGAAWQERRQRITSELPRMP